VKILSTPSLIAVLLAGACTAAVAEPSFDKVPKLLHKPLMGNSLKAAEMREGGVLRLQMDKPQVSELVYSTFVYHAICAEQWRHPEEFPKMGLQRVELFNADASTGYAFDTRGDVCERMGKMGQSYRSLITQHTAACSDNACPAPK